MQPIFTAQMAEMADSNLSSIVPSSNQSRERPFQFSSAKNSGILAATERLSRTWICSAASAPAAIDGGGGAHSQCSAHTANSFSETPAVTRPTTPRWMRAQQKGGPGETIEVCDDEGGPPPEPTQQMDAAFLQSIVEHMVSGGDESSPFLERDHQCWPGMGGVRGDGALHTGFFWLGYGLRALFLFTTYFLLFH